MSRLVRMVTVAIVMLAASATQVSAAPQPVIVTGHGAITNPNTPIYCPGLSDADAFTLAARGSSSELSAHGAMAASFLDGSTCTQLRVTARVDCLLVVGNQAVAFGPVTHLGGVVPGGLSFNYFAIVIQDNGAGGDIGNLIAVQLLHPPQDCSQVGLESLFNFLGYPVASGGVTLR